MLKLLCQNPDLVVRVQDLRRQHNPVISFRRALHLFRQRVQVPEENSVFRYGIRFYEDFYQRRSTIFNQLLHSAEEQT